MDNYSLSDIRAATGAEENGWGGGGAWWIIILFLFMFGMGGGGWGWGNRGNDALTRAEMQQGFDTQEITRKLDGLSYGMCDGFYAQNTTMLNGFAGVTSAVRDAQFAAQQCCCETNRNIDSVRYDAQKNTCDITTAIHAEGEATRALIQKNEMQNLRDRLQQMELREAMCGVVRYPMATTYTSGGNPFCGCNNGCNI
ncbi:MAG: hypothetical protein MR637_02065 [Clostridiales bacterium]|nr:hypothetical protein [Clostridiales bacterium]